jgi:RHS repeat-associated protein
MLLSLLALLPAPLAAQTNPSPFTSAVRYDEDGRTTGTIAPDPDGDGPLHYAAVRNTYDSGGRLVKTEKGELSAWQSEAVAPSAWTGFTIFETVDATYDGFDHKVSESRTTAGTALTLTQTSYDALGRVDCVATRMNPPYFAAEPGACTLSAAGNNGPDRITRNVWDAAGQLLQVQKAYGITTANFFPQTLQQNYVTYEYTPNGKQKAVTDANGNRAEMTFDGFDRQSRWIFSAPVGAKVANQSDYEEYGYDANDNRASLRKRDGVTLTYQYDALNRLRQKNVPASAGGAPGYSVYYGYDLRGLQTYARFGSDAGPGVTNTYDGADRLAGLDAIGHPIAQLGYDAAGRRSSLGQGYDTFASSASYGYDPVGRLQSLGHDLAGTASDQMLTFAYNPAGQVVARTSSNDSYASNTAYNVNRGYSVNGLNQYTAAGGATFTYDVNGNLTSDGTNSYVYDAENRLVSRLGGVSLAYDPLGRLWQVTSPTSLTRFLYDGDRLTIEYDGFGSVLRSYVHGAGPDEPLVWYEAAGGATWRRYLHTDHQGSIIAVADQNGNPLAINAYDSWGIPNSSNLGRFGYIGQAWLPELGMWYYKARLYSPTLGRFLQTDPVGYKDQVNLYAYVADDPLNNRDSSGKVMTALNPAQVTMLQTYINEVADGRYGFDKNNHLQREGPAEGDGPHSQEYAKILDAMIANPNEVTLRVADQLKTPAGNESVTANYGGGITLAPAPGTTTTDVIISGGGMAGVPALYGGSLQQTPGLIFMHELVVHAFRDQQGLFNQVDQTLTPENKIRAELGLPIRGADKNHPQGVIF